MHTQKFFTSVLIALLLSVLPFQPVPMAVAQTAGTLSASGWFTIIWGDGPGGTPAPEPIYELTDDSGQQFRLLMDQGLAVPLGGVLALNRHHITVQGAQASAVSEQDTAITLQVESISPDQGQEAQGADSVGTLVTGSQPYISILCKFQDVSTEPKALSYFQGMYGSNYPGLDHYWREVSYNNINLVGSNAVGWFTLPHPRSYYVYNTSFDQDRATHDCTAAADSAVNFTNFNGINMMFNDDLDGYSWGGGDYLTLDGVSRFWSLTWEPPWGYSDIAVISHEMGHSFGLPHSSGDYGEVYDNQWDVMSDTWSNCSRSTSPTYGCLGQHTIAFHKDMLGWIPASQKYVPGPNTDQTVTLEQLALPQNDNYKMVQIPLNSASHFYTVEVRRQTGYDIKLPGQAVIIHEVDTTRPEPAHVIDPDGNGNTGDVGAMWIPGETFTDPANNVSVRVVSATSTGFQVEIQCPCQADYPPATPSNLRVSGSTSTSVTLGWDDVSFETGYKIYKWNGVIGDFQYLASVGADVTSFTQTRSTCGWNDYYQVSAYNEYGESPQANWVQGFTKPCAPALNSPADGVTKPYNFDLTFKWNAATGASEYLVEWWGGSYSATQPCGWITATSCHVGLMTPGNTYSWHVKARNDSGESAWSSTWMITIDAQGFNTLTVTKTGTGSGTVTSDPPGINCGTDCSEAYLTNTQVTLTASPLAGSSFANWGGACTGTGSCVVSMTAAKTVTATFNIQKYTLTVTKAGNGGGTVTSDPTGISCGSDCSEAYDYDTSVTLSAAPLVGSSFSGWSGACSGTGSCVVSVTSAKSATATFTVNTYTLTVTKSGNGTGTLTSNPAGINCGSDCSETYVYNTSVSLSAAPAAGSDFTGWSGACSGTGPCVVGMTAAKSVGAAFVISPIKSIPTLIQPRTGSAINAIPTFAWTAVPNAQKYLFELSRDNTFATTVDQREITSLSFTPGSLFSNDTYYWHVRAFNAANEPGGWSATHSFTIDTVSPSAPVPGLPADGTTVRGVPVFRWSSVNGSVRYQFQIDNDAGFPTPLFSVMPRVPYLRPPGVLSGTYYWRVRAQDAAGNWSAWSTTLTVSILPLR